MDLNTPKGSIPIKRFKDTAISYTRVPQNLHDYNRHTTFRTQDISYTYVTVTEIELKCGTFLGLRFAPSA